MARIDWSASWYARLADWAAKPPTPRGYAREFKKDGARVWFCEIYGTLHDLERENEELRQEVSDLNDEVESWRGQYAMRTRKVNE